MCKRGCCIQFFLFIFIGSGPGGLSGLVPFWPMDPGAQLPGPAGRQHRGVAEAVGQRLRLLHPPLCRQPLGTIKVEESSEKRGLNLIISVIFEQVQPALLFQLLPNPRDELSAILHLRAATTSVSGHQLPPIPGGCSGRVRAHMVVRVKLRVRVGFSLVAFCILQYLKKICKSIKYFLQK